MSFIRAITECILGHTGCSPDDERVAQNDEALAIEIVDILYNSEKSGEELKTKVRHIVHAYSWTENLGKAVLNALDTAVRQGREMSPALKEAYDKAFEAADAVGGFVKEHPVFCTVVVLGILVLVMPWVIEAIGFAAEGVVADSFAAGWQARYMGYVPKGSLFSFFQRLGMVWHY